jgi:hypothetical protein
MNSNNINEETVKPLITIKEKVSKSKKVIERQSCDEKQEFIRKYNGSPSLRRSGGGPRSGPSLPGLPEGREAAVRYLPRYATGPSLAPYRTGEGRKPEGPEPRYATGPVGRPREREREVLDPFDKIKREAKNELERTVAKLMLNSLYGKIGKKEKDSRIKIVSKDEGEDIIKIFHYSYFSFINDNTVLIKYSSKLNDKLRKLYKDQEDEILNETYFKKERGILSAVQISCAIAAYARRIINFD